MCIRLFLVGVLALGLVACGGGQPREVPKSQKVQPAPQMVNGNPKFGDSDPVEWSGRKPWHHNVHGVDVSRYQAGVDWTKLAANNISFAYIKATEGGDHSDPEFYNHWTAAERAGLPRGAYHFYYFCRTAQEQANWFKRHVPRDSNALPPVLDIEWNHQSRNCPYKPEPEAVRSEMRVFLTDVAVYYGKQPMIYTTVDFYHTNELWKVNGYDFWLRSVAVHPSEIYAGERWTLWQYTGTGRVPGSPGNIDLNVFHGDPLAWQNWLVRNGVSVPH